MGIAEGQIAAVAEGLVALHGQQLAAALPGAGPSELAAAAFIARRAGEGTPFYAQVGFFETHTEKKDTDQKVGNILSLEGGLGKALLGGGLNLGAAYYAQWKLSEDQLGQDIDDALAAEGLPTPAKHRGYGIGPEVIVAFANETKLIGTLSLRYFWETGVRTNVQGSTFVATATFPLPSMPLQ